MATEEQHAAAVIAKFNELQAQAFDYDDIPTPRPDNYTEVSVIRRFGGNPRGSGERNTVELYRITERSVGLYVSNARKLRSNAGAIEGQTLTIDGAETTPVEFESADPIAPDDGWFSGLRTWIYCL